MKRLLFHSLLLLATFSLITPAAQAAPRNISLSGIIQTVNAVTRFEGDIEVRLSVAPNFIPGQINGSGRLVNLSTVKGTPVSVFDARRTPSNPFGQPIPIVFSSLTPGMVVRFDAQVPGPGILPIPNKMPLLRVTVVGSPSVIIGPGPV